MTEPDIAGRPLDLAGQPEKDQDARVGSLMAGVETTGSTASEVGGAVTAATRTELRIVVCRHCGCSIEDGGLCNYNCPFDSTIVANREPEDLQTLVYRLDRIESHEHRSPDGDGQGNNENPTQGFGGRPSAEDSQSFIPGYDSAVSEPPHSRAEIGRNRSVAITDESAAGSEPADAHSTILAASRPGETWQPKESMPNDEPSEWFTAAIADAFDSGRAFERLRAAAVPASPATENHHGYGCPYDGDTVTEPRPSDCPCDEHGHVPDSAFTSKRVPVSPPPQEPV